MSEKMVTMYIGGYPRRCPESKVEEILQKEVPFKMKQFVPLNKQSKQKQKEYYAQMRRDWNGISPVTRTVPSGKVYNRNRMKRDLQNAG